MEKYRPSQKMAGPNILPPLFNRDEAEAKQFLNVYGKDINKAVGPFNRYHFEDKR